MSELRRISRKKLPLQHGDPRCAEMVAVIYNRKTTVTEGRSKSIDRQDEWNLADAQRYGFKRIIILNEPEGARGEWWWQDDEGRNPLPYRKELTKLVRLIESGEAHAVIVYKGNRLYRDNGLTDALAKLFNKYGIHFICQGRDSDLGSARGRRDMAMDSAAAAEWREQISEDIIADHAYKVLHGMFSHDPSCFGWRSAGPKSQAAFPVWKEIDLAEMMMRWFVYGDDDGVPLGLYQIARKLTLGGISLSTGTKGRKRAEGSKHVNVDHVKRILGNCMFVARWSHNKEQYRCDRLLVSREGEAPRTAIPIALYEAVQDKLAQRPEKGRKSGCSGYLLTSLVVCGSCGRNMHVKTEVRKSGKRALRFTCPYRTGPIRACTGDSTAAILLPELDEWVKTYLAPQIAHELRDMRRIDDQHPRLAELSSVLRRLEELKAAEGEKLSHLVEAMDAEQLAVVAQTFRSERQRLEAKAAELRSLISTSQSRVGVQPTDLSSVSTPILREALRRCLRWIAVTDEGIVVNSLTSGLMASGYVKPKKIMKRPQPRKLLPAVGANASRVCRGWIGDPEGFLRGRRGHLGKKADHLADADLLPHTA